MTSYRHRRLAGLPARESELVSNTPIGAAALASLGTAALATSPASAASQGATR